LAFRSTSNLPWPPFFEWVRGGTFELESLSVTAGSDVAFAWALLRCGQPADLALRPDERLRLTAGLRRDGGAWTITHEHHSFTDKTSGAGDAGLP
jgi:ketosteroid isomerase-like protein